MNTLPYEKRHKIWNAEMLMAKELVEVCNKHGLKLFAAYGTLLGAVRHKGFIPWDDDMDFFMPRRDFAKLSKLGGEFKRPHIMESRQMDPNWPHFGYLKIVLDGTTALNEEERYSLYPYNHGVFIDVFAMDFVPDEEDEREQFIQEYLDITAYSYLRANPRPLNLRDHDKLRRIKADLGDKAAWSDEEFFSHLEGKLAKDRKSVV